ncbi:MAG: hypothetical protein M3N98_12200 [Actinomycetota bacterium]|nr:hypothetical protein [Actinomycetota bacterium]
MRNRILTAVAALSLALAGYLHLAIWKGGYRFAPVKEMFLLNVGLSAAVAAAVLFHPRKLTAAAGLALAAGSLVAFGLSRGPGLPTVHGTFTEMGLAPHNVRFLGTGAAAILLAAEAVAVVCCAAVLLARPAAAKAPRPSWATPVPA